MASGGEIIKEFVVSIKYKVDDAELQKANKAMNFGIGDMSKSVQGALNGLDDFIAGFISTSMKGLVAWTAGVSATFAAAGFAINNVTEKFKTLYYLQQQINSYFSTSGSSLMNLQLMGKLSGLGEDSLTGVITNISAALRDMPKGGLLRGIIGNDTDPQKVITDLAKFYNSIANTSAEPMVRAYLQNLNIDPDVIRQLGQNLKGIADYTQSYNDFLKNIGLSPDQVAQQSVEFQRNLALFDAMVGIITAKAVSEILPDLIAGLKDLSKWMSANSAEIKSTLDKLPGALETMFGWMQDFVDIVKYFSNSPLGNLLGSTASDAIDGVNQITETAAGTTSNLKGDNKNTNIAGQIIGPVIKTLADLVTGNFLKDPSIIPKDIEPASYVNDSNIAGKWLNGKFSDFVDWSLAFLQGKHHSPFVEIWDAKGFWPMMINWLRGSSTQVPIVKIQENVDSQQQQLFTQLQNLAQSLGGAGQGGSAPNVGLPITSAQQKQNMSAGLQFFMSKGLTEEQSMGIMARLFAESGLNPNSVNPTSGATGIGQWLGSRKPAALATGGDFNKQLQLVWDELNSTEKTAFSAIKASKTAAQSANAMELYERANDARFTAYASGLATAFQKQFVDKLTTITDHTTRAHALLSKPPVGVAPVPASGNRNISFNPSTTIHVNARGAEMGAVVFNATSRAHSTLYRNFYSKVG